MIAGGELRTDVLRVSGLRSPLLEAGPADSPEAVVFVHGNPGSSEDWRDLVGWTGAFARAVAFDMPGFGRASKPAGFDYSVPGYARYIDAAMHELGIERAHLVLHDFGGAFGLAWAAQHPDAFRSVVLINAPPVARYRWYLLAKVWRTPGAGELMHATLTRPFFDLNVKRGNPRGLPPAFVDRMWGDYDRGTRRAVIRLYRATDARHMVPAPPSAFARLDRPALVVWGMADAYIPIRFAERHRQAFPSAGFVFLERSGHWPFIDDPEGVADAVVPFLERQVGRVE